MTSRDGLAGFQSFRGPDPATGAAYSSADATGATEWVTPAPATNTSLVLTDLHLSVEGATSLSFYEEDTDVLVMRFDFAAAGALQWTPRSKIKLAAGKRLRVVAADTLQVTVLAQYTYESPNAPV